MAIVQPRNPACPRPFVAPRAHRSIHREPRPRARSWVGSPLRVLSQLHYRQQVLLGINHRPKRRLSSWVRTSARRLAAKFPSDWLHRFYAGRPSKDQRAQSPAPKNGNRDSQSAQTQACGAQHGAQSQWGKPWRMAPNPTTGEPRCCLQRILGLLPRRPIPPPSAHLPRLGDSYRNPRPSTFPAWRGSQKPISLPPGGALPPVEPSTSGLP